VVGFFRSGNRFDDTLARGGFIFFEAATGKQLFKKNMPGLWRIHDCGELSPRGRLLRQVGQ